MTNDLFKAAVVGPIAPRLLAVAGSCAECVSSRGVKDAEACSGFGPGCFGTRKATQARAEDLNVRLTVRRELL